MKKIKYLLLVLFLVFTLGIAVACNNEPSTPTTPEVETPAPTITKEMLENLKFEDATYDYTGEKYSITIEDLPEGVDVNYVGNNRNNPGNYTVYAYLTYGDIKVTLTATLKINQIDSVLTAEDNQVFTIYKGDYEPEYTLDNTKQKITYTYYKDGKKVSTSALNTPGDYQVKITALENSTYKETSVTINVKTVKSLLGLSFDSAKVEYDGNEHTLELTGELPADYEVEYVSNSGTETGNYYALAYVKNASGEVVETHAAVLEIVNPENAEFNEFLDMFFVEFLEGDQLSVNIFCENAADFGLEHYDAQWYSYEKSTEEDMVEYVAYLQELKDLLEEFKDARLSTLQQVAYRNIEKFLNENLAYYEYDNIQYLNINYVDSFGGKVADFSTYMEAYTLYSELEVQDIVDFIVSTDEAFNSYLTYVADRAEAGYALSNYTIIEMRGYLEDVLKDKDNYYLADVLCYKVDACEFLTEEEKASYKEQIRTEMVNSFMRGVQDLYDGLEQYIGMLSEENEGYLQIYENGKEYFVAELESLLGLNNFDMEEYIKTTEKALEDTMKGYMQARSAIMSANGYNSSAQVSSLVAKKIIKMGTPEQMMEYLKEFAPTIVPELESNPEIVIKNMDPASAEVSNAVAYYMKSAIDNTGAEYITLNQKLLGDSNDVLSTLAHEGYPGHLYAYVRSKEIGLHNLSVVMSNTAHAEGWATYVAIKLYEYAAEQHADDKNFGLVMNYLIAEQKMNYLIYSRIDAGIHYEGWDAAKVGTYMESNGYNGDAGQEIYNLLIEMPVTYAAYAYGKYEFVRLHEEAQAILGVHYDEVEFNDMIHSSGWVNLGELENIYHNYMEITCHKYGIEYNIEA